MLCVVRCSVVRVVAWSLLFFVVHVRLYRYVLLVGCCCRCLLFVVCWWLVVVGCLLCVVYRLLWLLIGRGRSLLSVVCWFVFVGVIRCDFCVLLIVLLLCVCVCSCLFFAVVVVRGLRFVCGRCCVCVVCCGS